jgi:Rrf2 family protein
MRLSTKGRYGVRLMLELAWKYGNGPVTLKYVAERQQISEKYLWHLIRQLKNAGLVRSTRGTHGGYVLARPAEEINLKDIIFALEGPMDFAECTDDLKRDKRTDGCAAREVWTEITEKISDLLESYSLSQILKIQEQKSGRNLSDYVI